MWCEPTRPHTGGKLPVKIQSPSCVPRESGICAGLVLLPFLVRKLSIINDDVHGFSASADAAGTTGPSGLAHHPRATRGVPDQLKGSSCLSYNTIPKKHKQEMHL